MRGDLTVRLTQFGQTARRTGADGWRIAQRVVVLTGRVLRAGFLATLEALETVLLSPVGRERVHATATFSLIFLFAVTSIDFLITGGAEFAAPARAAQRPSLVQVAYTPAPVRAEETPTEIAAPLADATEANVTAVSQNFFASLSPAPASAPTALVSLNARESEVSQPLVDETSPADEAGAASAPRKERPASPRRKTS
jgi:hypothetical protein